MMKIQERTSITNKDNMQAEITRTTVDQTVLATVDPAALRQEKPFSSYDGTIDKKNKQSPLNQNSSN